MRPVVFAGVFGLLVLGGSAQAREVCETYPDMPRGCYEVPDDESGGREKYDEPSFDPQADARGRINALVRNFSDILGPSWSGVNFDGANLDAGLANLRHQIWGVSAKAATDAAEQRLLIQQAQQWIHSVSETLLAENDALAALAPQLDEARNTRDALKAKIFAGEVAIDKEGTLTVQADHFWLDERNKAIKALRAAWPTAQGLPTELDDIGFLPVPKTKFDSEMQAMQVSPSPEEPRGFVSPVPILALPFAAGHYEPAIETAPPSGLTERVGEIERLATQARANLQDQRGAKAEVDTLRQNYDSVSQRAESARQQLEYQTREMNYLKALNAHLQSSSLVQEVEQRRSAWFHAVNAAKAVVWDVFTEKAVMPMVQQLPHYSVMERANRVGYLIKQVQSLEKDFEVLSPAAARTIGPGPHHGNRKHSREGLGHQRRSDGRDSQ